MATGAAVLALLGATSPVVAESAERNPLPSPLGIEDVRRYARAHRAEIGAARARTRAAAERPAVVSALEDPMLSPSLDHLPFALHGADVSLSIEQRFPLSRVLGHRRRVAEAEASRLHADQGRVGLDVELDAVTAFLMLRERRGMADIVARQLDLARALLSAVNARYAGGTGSQADVLRAELEVARLQGSVGAMRAAVRAAESMLNASLGRDAYAEVPRLATPDAPSSPAGAGRVREAALRRRPELAVGRAEIQRAEAEIAVMESMDAPMAMVRTGPAYTMAEGAGWMAMVGISIPLWRERATAGVREARAMADMARADLAAMTRMVEGEAAVTRQLVLAARERVVSLRDDVLPRARRAIEPALAGYASGTVQLVGVLDTLQASWTVEAELVSAELELGLAWARFERATAEGGSAQ